MRSWSIFDKTRKAHQVGSLQFCFFAYLSLRNDVRVQFKKINEGKRKTLKNKEMSNKNK